MTTITQTSILQRFFGICAAQGVDCDQQISRLAVIGFGHVDMVPKARENPMPAVGGNPVARARRRARGRDKCDSERSGHSGSSQKAAR